MQQLTRTALEPAAGDRDEGDAPLCIDLDGTLVKTDLLVEALLGLVRTHPLKTLLIPIWLMRGKAYLKGRVAELVELDVTTMPYDERVMGLVKARREAGYRAVLATASHERYARQVAQHLGIFDEVLATTTEVNLSGANKRRALVDRYGDKCFDYAGNDRKDVEVWRAARHAIVVNASPKVERAARHVAHVEHVISGPQGGFAAYAKALRLHQWLKNLLIFVPMFMAHLVSDVPLVALTTVAFFAFGLTASSVYVLNDLVDLEADRIHATKRKRPFAAGVIQLSRGVVLAPSLLLAAGLLCLLLPPMFAAVLALYYATTLAYSLVLKRLIMLDVVTLAGLYTVRIVAGSAVMGVPPSYWLLAFSVFLFLSLALVKRCSELMELRKRQREAAKGRAYRVADLPIILSLGSASAYVAVLVAALYINSPDVLKLYGRPALLWLVCVALLAWTSRLWILVHRGEIHEDPVIFAMRDPWSLVLGVIVVALVLLAS
jgi:4-hydroxybenzoate polyprenyltransferase/phosphoserine phosphatase